MELLEILKQSKEVSLTIGKWVLNTNNGTQIPFHRIIKIEYDVKQFLLDDYINGDLR